MGWFAMQLAVLLLLAFAAGLGTGYLWWVWGWKKHELTADEMRRLASERPTASR